MTFTIAPIVEGHGDVVAIPVLLRMLRPELRIARPIRFPKTKLLIDSELSRATRIARANVLPHGGLILLLIDADEDCPASQGPALLQVMKTAVNDTDCFVAIATREFECWILGGDPQFGESQPESAGAPKSRIARVNGGKYKETVDQARFAAGIDTTLLADRSASFRRLRDRLIPIADQLNPPL